LLNLKIKDNRFIKYLHWENKKHAPNSMALWKWGMFKT